MIHRTVARRRGFTLVELMLVVALMAVLVALSTGAYFRIRASELVRATEATESKLNTLMDKRWTAIRDQADTDLKTNTPAVAVVLQFAGNDKDRARTIWTYLKFKNEFPTTIAEACNPVTLPTGFVVFTPRSVFTSQFGVGAAGLPTPPPEESAAVFYLALTATGNRGETVGPDGTQQQTGDVSITFTPPAGTQTSKPMRAYMDSWGNPIMFVRMASPDEVNASPYIRATGNTNRDFLDPMAKLLTPSATWTAPPSTPSPNSMLDLFWAKVMQNHISAGVGTSNLTTYSNPSRNWVPTVISMGPNKKWDGFFDQDNIVSYRLRREGNRGD